MFTYRSIRSWRAQRPAASASICARDWDGAYNIPSSVSNDKGIRRTQNNLNTRSIGPFCDVDSSLLGVSILHSRSKHAVCYDVGLWPSKRRKRGNRYSRRCSRFQNGTRLVESSTRGKDVQTILVACSRYSWILVAKWEHPHKNSKKEWE